MHLMVNTDIIAPKHTTSHHYRTALWNVMEVTFIEEKGGGKICSNYPFLPLPFSFSFHPVEMA